jgi:hypothetical protein
MVSFNTIVQKKVFGIPVVYLALIVVAGLAFLAWKIKPTVTPVADTPADGLGPEVDPDTSGLETTGTVIVAPQPNVPADAIEQTNDKWLRSGVDYLVNEAKVATAGDAQLALSTYLEGGDLTYEQGLWRDKVIGKLGLPPESLPRVGITTTAPAQKQFTAFPGKHTVKGSNDNTASKLANLYYGSGDAAHTNRVVEMNTGLGPATTTYTPGTVVNIPGYTYPNYYTVTGKNKDNYFTTLAGKFGLSVAQVQALNPTLTQPIPKGTKVRSQ